MQIETLQVENLRSIAKLEVKFDKVTALLGGNNCGKSTVLRALQIFFEAAPRIGDDDYHKGAAEEIKVTITFARLTPAEVSEFGTAVVDGKLTVSRSFSRDKDSNLTYSVQSKSFAAFAPIREETNKTTRRTEYNKIAKAIGAQAASNSEEVDAFMEAWEAGNPNELTLQTTRGFFGAPNVANGKLRKKTSLHFIPAVADASEQTSDPRKSPIILLLADISRQIYENRKEVQDFIAKAKTDFGALVAPDQFPQLAEISKSLTDTVQKYYRDSKLLAQWAPEEDGIKVAFPQPTIRVEDSGFVSGLQNVGHGLQRASLFAVIEFLARSSAAAGQEVFQVPQSDIILLVEEPEIYQHPHKQQIINDAFHTVCAAFSADTGIRFQIAFATHSEKFVGISKFQSARILRRTEKDGDTINSASAVDLMEMSQYFADLKKVQPMTEEAFEAKMHIFSRELCEGFFAQKIILVEGVADKAVLEGTYKALGRDALAEGISIISVDGKTKLDKPFYIFRKLGIPTYAVFDSDRSEKKQRVETNHMLQRIAGNDEPIDFPDGCFAKYASLDGNLEVYIKAVCGPLWDAEISAIAEEFGLDMSDICKTPAAVSEALRRCREKGANFTFFDGIVQSADTLTSG